MSTTPINYATYEAFIHNLDQLLSDSSHICHKPVVLAIDGMCGSGKTTLAEYLCSIFDASVIHMDNFFLPFERKTPERLAEAGGNIDYERFLELVIPSLMDRKPFSYTAYNCQTAAYDRDIIIRECQLIIVEGSYCLHEKFGKYYDYALFLEVSPDEQLHRLESRCQNEALFQRFKNEWIPMEKHYHAAQNVLSRCDTCIDTSKQ